MFEALLGREYRYTITAHSPDELVLSTMARFHVKKFPIYEVLARNAE